MVGELRLTRHLRSQLRHCLRALDGSPRRGEEGSEVGGVGGRGDKDEEEPPNLFAGRDVWSDAVQPLCKRKSNALSTRDEMFVVHSSSVLPSSSETEW